MTYGSTNNIQSFDSRSRRAGLPRTTNNSDGQATAGYDQGRRPNCARAGTESSVAHQRSQRMAEPRIRDSVLDFAQASHFLGPAPEHYPGAPSSESPRGPRIRDSVLDFAQVNNFMGFAPEFTAAKPTTTGYSQYSSTVPSRPAYPPAHPRRSLSPVSPVSSFDYNLDISGFDADYNGREKYEGRPLPPPPHIQTRPALTHQKPQVHFEGRPSRQPPSTRPAPGPRAATQLEGRPSRQSPAPRPAPGRRAATHHEGFEGRPSHQSPAARVAPQAGTQPQKAPEYFLFPRERQSPVRHAPHLGTAATTRPQTSRKAAPNERPDAYSRSVPTTFAEVLADRREQIGEKKKGKSFFRSLFSSKKKK